MDTSKLNYSFHDFPGPTHWDCARQWSLVYLGPRHAWLRCCVWWCSDCSVTAQELGQRHFLLVQSLRAQQGWRFWGSFSSCFLCLCSTSRRIHQNTTSTAGDGKSWLSHVAVDRALIDCSTLLPRYANKLDGQAWRGWQNLHETSPKGQCLELGKGMFGMDHGSTVLDRTHQNKPKTWLTSFFCCPTWLVVFLHKSLFSVAVRLQNASKHYKTVLWISSNAEKMQFTSDYL